MTKVRLATENFGMEASQPRHLRDGGNTPYDGSGPPGGDDMRERIAKLEIQVEHIDARLDRIEDKLLSKWDVAKVQAGMILFAITLIMLGPRLLSLLQASAP